MDIPLKRWTALPAWVRLLAALVLFAGAYAIANRYQLVQAVLYRAAAEDWGSAVVAMAVLCGQALALLGGLLLLPGRWLAPVLVAIALSVLVNLGFTGTVGALLDAGKLAWLFAEARQAGEAGGEFARPLLLAGAQTLVAVGLLWAARAAAGPMLARRTLPGLALLLLPGLLVLPLGLHPPAAERNLYAFGGRVLAAEPPPPRAPVDLPRKAGTQPPRHIVWLVDESVAYEPFARLIAPDLARYRPVDFGPAASLGHCSGPANLALRSGVAVRSVGPATDLRATPSIWGYAKAAGYRTRMIEAQTSGPPQNFLLPPERALIDDYIEAAHGIDTDREVAARINHALREDGPSFTYAVLRGVHFQYRDHVPPRTLPADAPKRVQYEAALAYSKTRFFDLLLDGLDREEVAIAYLSDHGQNLAEGVLAHCSRDPVADEFRIPLIAFLPERLAARYAEAERDGRSASQLFAATLIWMGYPPAVVERRYDNDLARRTARYVWFDRDVVPLSPGDPVGVTAGPDFPGRAD